MTLDDFCVHFPEGLVGFPEWRRFELKLGTLDGVVRLLQAQDDPDVCFLVTDPADLCPDYACPIGQHDLEAVGAASADELRLFCTLTVREGEEQPLTANLLGPLAVNPRTGLGLQLILEGSDYSARTPIATCEREEAACLTAHG